MRHRNHILTLSMVWALLAALVACDDPAQELADAPDLTADLRDDASDAAPEDLDAGDGDVTPPDLAPDDAPEEVEQLGPLPERPWSPLAPGHYNVGYREWPITYTPRGMDAPRESVVSAWYPTLDARGEATVYPFTFLRRAEVFREASVGLTEPAPVLIFSHGDKSFPENSDFLCAFFASHGWIVIAPVHTGNTIIEAGRDRASQQFEWRPQDLSAALDSLYARPEGDPLARLASDEVVVSGHSYGGYTTLALAGAAYDVDAILADCEILDDPSCAYADEAQGRYRAGFFDDRVDLAIPMAPGNGDAFGAGLAEVRTPTLLMTGLLDSSLADARHGAPIWAALDDPRDLRVQLLTGGHHTFSNTCELLGGTGGNGCGDGFLDPQEAHRLISALALTFARVHLWGDMTDVDLLTGQAPLSDQIERSTHP